MELNSAIYTEECRLVDNRNVMESHQTTFNTTNTRLAAHWSEMIILLLLLGLRPQSSPVLPFTECELTLKVLNQLEVRLLLKAVPP